ncbi:MAG: hypothetical protein UT09_C0010G0023 [Parcubacteria group bacterium GW2011_GWF2_38_8]|nr:MAG: hypothetical protein UT09_C0010G0023 [Parcubacteria group bacterium GW2011_GWF2_38_8]
MEQSRIGGEGDEKMKIALGYNKTNLYRKKIENMEIEIESSDLITIEKIPPSSSFKLIRENVDFDGKNVSIYRLGNEIYLYMHIKEQKAEK